MSMRIEWGAHSDRGRVRTRNEDHHLFWVSDEEANPIKGLFVVADGMGGHPGGHEASRLAAQELKVSLTSLPDSSPSMEDTLADAFLKAHRKIREEGRREPSLDGMGTTLTALVVTERKLLSGHVGDSRLYELRSGEGHRSLHQCTVDHTVAREQSDAGIISPDRVEDHPLSHVLTRSVGAGEAPGVDVVDLGPGTETARTFLLCTDGLVRVVDEDEIPDTVGDKPLAEAAKALVELANQRGAPDNVTVVLVRIRSDS